MKNSCLDGFRHGKFSSEERSWWLRILFQSQWARVLEGFIIGSPMSVMAGSWLKLIESRKLVLHATWTNL